MTHALQRFKRIQCNYLLRLQLLISKTLISLTEEISSSENPGCGRVTPSLDELAAVTDGGENFVNLKGTVH